MRDLTTDAICTAAEDPPPRARVIFDSGLEDPLYLHTDLHSGCNAAAFIDLHLGRSDVVGNRNGRTLVSDPWSDSLARSFFLSPLWCWWCS